MSFEIFSATSSYTSGLSEDGINADELWPV